jgi:two-component system, chemotaxis family, protein-glutamate methylesterase/glutaminase
VVERIKVAIVDDSLFIRTILSDMLSTDSEIEVVGTAKDGFEAIRLIETKEIDVVTMDIVMPKMDGIQALEKIMKMKEPPSVMMLSAADRASADNVMRSLEIGAFDFILKPASTSSTDILRLKWEILAKIKAAFKAEWKRAPEECIADLKAPASEPKNAPSSERVIAIGSSTGGPVALRYILSCMPATLPAPIVIAQHMPKAFTESFAERLDKKTRITIKEAEEGDILKDAHAYIAPGDRHMRIFSNERRKLEVAFEEGGRIKGGRPSVDLLLTSTAEAAGNKAIGIILTGMGSDGARGIKKIKEVGGFTIAQDEETSLVWSMPHSAIKLGAVDKVLSLQNIPAALLTRMGVRR